MPLASNLSGAAVRRRLSMMATAAMLGAALLASAAADAATVSYTFTASKFTRLSPLASVSGSFSIDYADGANHQSASLGPTATLSAVDLTIGGSHFDTSNTALRFRSSDRLMTLGGTAGSSLSVLDADTVDFLFNFALGGAVDNRPSAKSFVYSLAEGESYGATKLATAITPLAARAALSRASTFAAESVVTPIPAPALLFASALGLGALLRRRQGTRPMGEPRLG